jgi:APA family basic amino acid/polyamine antiporter
MTAPTEERPEEFLGDLRLGRRLSTAAQVGAGGMLAILALIILIGGPSVIMVGPPGALAALLAGVSVGLTLMNVIELLGGSGEHGGLFHLVHETLGGISGFLTGWALLAGEILLAAGLAKVTGSYIIELAPELQQHGTWLGLAIFAGLILLGLFRPAALRGWLWPAFVLLMATLVLMVMSVIPNLNVESLTSGARTPPGTFLRASAWFSLMYAGLEIVLAARRQSTNPSKLAPPALLWSLTFGVGAFVLVHLSLGALRQTGLITLETSFLDLLDGVSLLPVWIPLYASILALLLGTNRLSMTASRQIYALVREGTLPEFLRAVPGLFRVPPLLFLSLLVIGLPAIIWAPTRWLIDVAAALFLFPALMLSLAAIFSRRLQPDRRRTFSTPFHPLVPSLAFALNLTLLLAIPTMRLASAAMWMAGGALLFLL